MMDVKPPEELSQRLLGAIQGALREEKQPRSMRYLKVAAATLISTLILTLPIALIFREQLGWVWKLACAVWALCFLAGFSLHFYPQPRLTVPGYWSPTTFAKILIGMTALTGVQTLLCPSFVFLDSSLGWAPFAPVTEFFMRWGGMQACMFSCGLLFTSLGAVVTFFTVRRVLSRSSRPALAKAAALAYLTQIPIIGVQCVDGNLRPFAVFWGLGSGLGLLTVTFCVSRVARFLKTRAERA